MWLAERRRLPKKKDLFDPTDDKWVHDKFDLPPEQDLEYDTVRMCLVLCAWTNLRHIAADVKHGTYAWLLCAASSEAVCITLLCTQLAASFGQQFGLKRALLCRRVLLVAEGGGAAGAIRAGHSAGVVAAPAAALPTQMATRALTPATMSRASTHQLRQLQMPSWQRAIGRRLMRSSGLHPVRVLGHHPPQQLEARGTSPTMGVS